MNPNMWNERRHVTQVLHGADNEARRKKSSMLFLFREEDVCLNGRNCLFSPFSKRHVNADITSNDELTNRFNNLQINGYSLIIQEQLKLCI